MAELAVFTTVFVDILGFAPLVLRDEDGIPMLNSFLASSQSLDELKADWEDRRYTTELERVFTGFHRALELRVEEVVPATGLHSIIFSDSAFVAFEDAATALYFAQLLMRSLIYVEVPARIGISSGSFRALSFKTHTGDRTSLHTSHFLGTSIVKAHQAETCGAKGLRILLHPDLVVPEEFVPETIPLATTAHPDRCAVANELSYLAPYEPDPSHQSSRLIDRTNTHLYQAIGAMASRAPKDKREHYDDTFTALEAMRTRLGLRDWILPD